MLFRRLFIIFAAFLLLSAGLAVRLFHLQVSQAQKWEDEAKVFVHRHRILETHRGEIVDRQGERLALDKPCYDLAIDYRAMNLDDRWLTRQAIRRMKEQGVSEREERIRKLSATKLAIANEIDHIEDEIAMRCRVPVEAVRARFDAIRERIRMLRQDRWVRPFDRNDRNAAAEAVDIDVNDPLREEFIAHPVVTDLPDDVAFYFSQNLDKYPGLAVVDSRRRWYPYKDVGCHIIGALRPVRPEDLRAHRFDRPDLLLETEDGDLRGYLPGDLAGEHGIEALVEKTLRGTRGIRLVDIEGGEIPGKRIDPQAGEAVQLTLDIKLQRDIQEALLANDRKLLRGQDGNTHLAAIVAMTVEGEVLALVSLPTYDLNRYEELLSTLLTDNEGKPLRNKATSSFYPPGSIMKALVASAAISEGLVTPGDTITCNGHLFPNNRFTYRCSVFVDHKATHGPMTLVPALEESCNIYFYTLGMRLGTQRIVKWYERFGFRDETGLELRESRGQLLNLADNQGRRLTEEQDRSNAILLGIGQGPIAVTPLQMAHAYATLLRGGTVVPPRLLKSSEPKVVARLPISPETVQAVREGLYRCVHGQRGTARRAFAGLEVDVAGKTGSATNNRTAIINGERVELDSDAWFVGYAPAKTPKVVVAAILENGGHGGAAAAPMVREVMTQLQKHGYLE